jgi:hypothetical protein
MAWLSNDRSPTKSDEVARPREPLARPAPDALQPGAVRETTPRQFAVRLAMMLGFALITPGFHLRSLATLSAAVGVIVAYGAACARERLDAPCFSAWDEAITFLSIAWLAFRLF